MKHLSSLALLFFPVYLAVKREKEGAFASAACIPHSCYGDTGPNTPGCMRRESKAALETGATVQSDQLLEQRIETTDTCQGRGEVFQCEHVATHPDGGVWHAVG